MFLHKTTLHRNIAFQGLNIEHTKSSWLHFLVGDVTDLHVIIDIERDCHDVFSVQFFADHTTANGIPIDADQEIKEGCAVADNDVFF